MKLFRDKKRWCFKALYASKFSIFPCQRYQNLPIYCTNPFTYHFRHYGSFFLCGFQRKVMFCSFLGPEIWDLRTQDTHQFLFFHASGTKFSKFIVTTHLCIIFSIVETHSHMVFTILEDFLGIFQWKNTFGPLLGPEIGDLGPKTHTNFVFFHANCNNVS